MSFVPDVLSGAGARALLNQLSRRYAVSSPQATTITRISLSNDQLMHYRLGHANNVVQGRVVRSGLPFVVWQVFDAADRLVSIAPPRVGEMQSLDLALYDGAVSIGALALDFQILGETRVLLFVDERKGETIGQ